MLLPPGDSRLNRLGSQVKSLFLPLSWWFFKIFFSLVTIGKVCEGKESLTQISTDQTEVMPQPTPANAASKLHGDGGFLLKKHFC